MATLYDIDERIQTLIDEETGEITDIEALERLQLERTEKCENIALAIKNAVADAAAYKAEKQAFEKKQKTAENKVESLKKYLAYALNGESLKTSRVQCVLKKSKSVNIIDLSKLPKEYLRYSEPTADKTALKAAIEAGTIIDGVELVEKENIIVR